MPRKPSDATAAMTETDTAVLVPMLRAFAWSCHSDPGDADDLVRKTLTEALCKARHFTPGTNLSAWLLSIMRHIIHSEHECALPESSGNSRRVSGKAGRTPRQEWSAREQGLSAAIRKLPQSQREVIVLVGVLGLSCKDAAEVCECETGTVKNRLYCARSTLQEALVQRPPPGRTTERQAPLSAVDPHFPGRFQRV